ncbi:MAG: glutamyl-tRNA reductase, partial [Ghiorsea sp.]|nr:glutamyl-tRNA reductase [Ghiorsea sp.]
DDLQQVVQGNQQNREKEAEQAKVLIEEDANAFLIWLKSLESVPLIRGIQQQVEKARLEEMEKAKRYLKGLSAEQEEAVERLSKSLMKRFVHPTMQTLKTLPDDIEGDLLMGAASRLFAAKPINDPHKIDKAREPDEHASG